MVPLLCPMKDTVLVFISHRDRVSREGPIMNLIKKYLLGKALHPELMALLSVNEPQKMKKSLKELVY